MGVIHGFFFIQSKIRLQENKYEDQNFCADRFRRRDCYSGGRGEGQSDERREIGSAPVQKRNGSQSESDKRNGSQSGSQSGSDKRSGSQSGSKSGTQSGSQSGSDERREIRSAPFQKGGF